MSPAVPKEFIHTNSILPIHQRWDPITPFPPWLHIIWEGRKLIFICEYKLYCHEERTVIWIELQFSFCLHLLTRQIHPKPWLQVMQMSQMCLQLWCSFPMPPSTEEVLKPSGECIAVANIAWRTCHLELWISQDTKNFKQEVGSWFPILGGYLSMFGSKPMT